MVTDPPYNVAVENEQGATIKNDNLSNDDFYNLLRDAFSNAAMRMRPGAAFYVWHADTERMNFQKALEEVGFSVRQNLIWVKNAFTLGRQDYQWKHEPCLYGWKDGAGHYFQEARNIPTVFQGKKPDDMTEAEIREFVEMILERTTVWHENKPMVDDLHPTMKPISLIEKQVKNSSKRGWHVLDLFGGSGTTLLACEKLGRKCYMMELDPKYVDVIIAQWEETTGEKAVLRND